MLKIFKCDIFIVNRRPQTYNTPNWQNSIEFFEQHIENVPNQVSRMAQMTSQENFKSKTSAFRCDWHSMLRLETRFSNDLRLRNAA